MHRVKRYTHSAFSLIELLTVISIIGILASFLLVAMSSARAKSRQTACVNNLHQIGLGFTGYALDHEGKYPMDVPERLGGSMEYNQSLIISHTPFSRDFHHFRVLSNEIPNVKIMLCPADRRRQAARDYRSFTNENLSYWVNTKAAPHATLATLAGDWNIHNSGATNDLTLITFGREVHRRQGSVLFADGRVEITRSIAVATQAEPPAVVASVPPSQRQPQTAGAPRRARPQPASHTPPPAVSTPQPSPSATKAPAALKDEPENKPLTRPELVETNQAAKLPVATQVQMGSGYRMSGGGGGATPAAAGSNPDSPPRAFYTPSGPGEPADAEPWDTPRFRMFKALAFVSYLISLLWALVALLLLYLRSRIAQREAERNAAINVD